MIYKDLIYGDFEIKEPVVLDLLLNSKALQRLKFIDQAGYRPLWVKPEVPFKDIEHSRFAHSMGVYILLNRFNASVEEQVAGLLHDVSHSAFSHCIDYALGEGSEESHSHQDKIFESFIQRTEIPYILKRNRFRPDFIFDEANFPLKERQIPDLCADRIDYSLRSALIFEEVTKQKLLFLLSQIETEDGYWFFKSSSAAEFYAQIFLRMNRRYYSSFAGVVMFKAVGDCLKYALDKGYIQEQDLYGNDKSVLAKIEIKANKDPKLKKLFQRMNDKSKTVNDPYNYTVEVHCKSRVVDPLFQKESKLKRLSEEIPQWRDIVYEELKPKKYFLRFLS